MFSQLDTVKLMIICMFCCCVATDKGRTHHFPSSLLLCLSSLELGSHLELHSDYIALITLWKMRAGAVFA